MAQGKSRRWKDSVPATPGLARWGWWGDQEPLLELLRRFLLLRRLKTHSKQNDKSLTVSGKSLDSCVSLS